MTSSLTLITANELLIYITDWKDKKEAECNQVTYVHVNSVIVNYIIYCMKAKC